MTRYRIDPVPVGSGGFGKVRPGVDSVLDRKIAVKSLDPAWSSADADDKERFRREAKTLATLSHPNIPAIYDVVFNDQSFEIIFQFVEGDTLRVILESEESVTLANCRVWFDQLASALQHAHEKGIIHRDIKPENIIVSHDRKHCYLVDFGIALSQSEIQRLTGSDNWVGTPGYMSPEQEQGSDLDSSDDLYVLGGCLYEALSGHRIEQGNYQPLSTLSELIPPAIDALIQKCIASKARRLKNAADFRNALKQALQHHRTISEVLAGGPLSEVVSAIAAMSPSQFMELKAGQRLLILQKCADIVVANDRRFLAARNEFLSVMICLGIHLNPDDYRKIVTPSITLGLGAATDDSPYTKGIALIRDALVNAAHDVSQPNHHVIVEEILAWLKDVRLETQKTGLYHGLRILLSALMANSDCDDKDAPGLAEILARINELHRSHTSDGVQVESESVQSVEQPSAG